MAKVIPLPVPRDATLAIPLADGAVLRLLPCRESPHVMLALYGPRGGNAGGVLLHHERARLLAGWLERLSGGSGGVRRDVGSGGPPVALPSATPFILDATLDTDAAARNLARLAVPSFADWWMLDVLEAGGGMRRLAVAHADPARARAARKLRDFPPDPRGTHGKARALRTRRPHLAARLRDDHLMAAARSPEHLAVMRSLGCCSAIAVPLLAGRRSLGVMTFVTAESGRRYRAADVEAADGFARCAALLLRNARVYGRARDALAGRPP